jgi:hypothetical protein
MPRPEDYGFDLGLGGENGWVASGLERLPITVRTTIYDPIARQKRTELLAAHPELRRTIDTAPLREIIDFVAFKCSPICSIARGEAVEGSDVDAALVVLRESVPQKAEVAFVQELRRQGFVAYHVVDIDAAEAARAATLKRLADDPSATANDYYEVPSSFSLTFAQIRFMTEAELQDPNANRNARNIYYEGYSIGTE